MDAVVNGRPAAAQPALVERLGNSPTVGSQWLLPSGTPVVRRGLCMLAQPCLRRPQHARRFRFFEATLLLVSSGRLTLDNGEALMELDGPLTLMAVAQNACADIKKIPGGHDLTFRSL